MDKLEQKREEFTAKAKTLHTVFEEAGDELDMAKVAVIEGTTVEKVHKLNQMNDELADLVDEIKTLETLAQSKAIGDQAENYIAALDGKRPFFPAPATGSSGGEQKSIGELFLEAGVGQEFKGKGIDLPDFDVKTLMSTSAGWAPEVLRTGRVVLDAQRPPSVLDFIPFGATSQSAIKYMEETTFTNNAAEVAEAGTYGEAALALTERTSPVEKIGVWLPITDEQIEDEAQALGYVNRRLPFMIRQRASLQILVGDGISPNLEGILNVTNVQTQAKGADPTPDAVYKAMTKVMVTGQAMPDLYVTHPNDWQDVRLLRTVDGIYIWGSPADAGPARIWGLPVALEQAITENTGLVGAFEEFAEFAVRRGIEMKVTDSHSDFFIKGKQAIRADFRAALTVYRPEAFCMVTGI